MTKKSFIFPIENKIQDMSYVLVSQLYDLLVLKRTGKDNTKEK